MSLAHGITVTEVSEGARALVTVATAVVGLVATGPAADNDVFPLNKPVQVTNLSAAIGAAGATGTLRGALQAIADQAKPVLVVVRVAPGADAAATSAAVIGTTDNQGQKTGMQALLAAETQLGVKPRIIGAPGLDTQAVTTALVVVAQKLRAMVYASAIGADIAAAITYRGLFDARELMLITPDFKALDTAGATVTSFAVARAMGLRARIDAEQGWNKTLSNVAVQGVLGTTKDIGFDLQDPNCEANLLNAAEVTTIIRGPGGFRFWGSRTCSDDPLFAFESSTRTAQVLQDTIASGMMWAIDKPLRASLVKDIVETINAELRAMKSAGLILGGKTWFDVEKNPTASLAGGKVTIDYDYTPTPPLESLLLNQRITDSYLVELTAGATANAA
jgi:phage tail sheath protein FI